MANLNESLQLLKELEVPTKLQSEMCAYTLLALANISPTQKWKDAENHWVRIHDIRDFISKTYGKNYAENTRETIRKNCLKPFRDAAFVEDNGKPTNSPNYRWRLTEEFLELIRSYRGNNWQQKLFAFFAKQESLVKKYSSKRKMEMFPIHIGKNVYLFSPGDHNILQKAILEEFAPRFAPNSLCAYVGDTTQKDLVKNEVLLKELHLDITLHDQMPDVVLYRKDKNWLYFIEAVTSVGPMTPQRVSELQKMSCSSKNGKIFVTAFLDFKTFKKFSSMLAWETEVWIAEMPDHMIHMNGDRFLGPRD